MTDVLHGALMAGFAQDTCTPGETQLVLDYLRADGASLSDILDEAFEGQQVEVAAEAFHFASDTRLITNLDGVIVYWNAKAEAGLPTYFIDKVIHGTFVVLAIVAGEVTCFLSRDQVDNMSGWLADKQVMWYGQFHSTQGEAETEKEGRREGRQKLH